MKSAPHILLSSYLVKRAADAADPQIDPRILAALVGGGGGALAGGGIQALRKMFQSKRDEEENGSPSILNGMMLGGLGGAGLGAGLQHMGMQDAAQLKKQTEAAKAYEALAAGGRRTAGVPEILQAKGMFTPKPTLNSAPSSLSGQLSASSPELYDPEFLNKSLPGAEKAEFKRGLPQAPGRGMLESIFGNIQTPGVSRDLRAQQDLMATGEDTGLVNALASHPDMLTPQQRGTAVASQADLFKKFRDRSTQMAGSLAP